MSASINLLDSENRIVPLAKGAGQLKIRSCDAKGNPRKSEEDVVLAFAKNADVSDVSAIEFVFTIDSKDAVGVAFCEDSYIWVKRLYARIPEGVTLDLAEQFGTKDSEEQEENN